MNRDHVAALLLQGMLSNPRIIATGEDTTNLVLTTPPQYLVDKAMQLAKAWEAACAADPLPAPAAPAERKLIRADGRSDVEIHFVADEAQVHAKAMRAAGWREA